MENFIGIYDNALSDEECDRLINHHETSSTGKGHVIIEGKSVEEISHKKSIEIDESVFSNPDHKIIYDIVYENLIKYTNKYIEKYFPIKYIAKWQIDHEFSFKKFVDESYGFKMWHTEHGPGEVSTRILVWMYYLNDAESGTEFQFYPKIKAKKGRLVIWPASWTHFHRSEPNKGLKYILSGWYSFY